MTNDLLESLHFLFHTISFTYKKGLYHSFTTYGNTLYSHRIPFVATVVDPRNSYR